ncbi:MAG: LPS export ABC transporter permease LptF [Rhodocyclaceae bacterium]|nr:LPS export ABC transporter permease LptF [Rhodocyclaceae bacterium]
MILQRSVAREFASVAVAVFVALFAILLTTQLIRLLGQAAGGELASEAVVALLGFGALNYLPILLSLTVFVAVLLTLSRCYRDSEMIVWFTSGVPLTAFIGPVLRFALPIVVVIALLSLFLSPWALGKSAEYKNRVESRDDVSQVSPGAFRESAGADRVLFVEGVDGVASTAARVRNVFVSSMQHGRLGVMVASQGHVETMGNGDRFVVLENGRRYEGEPGKPEYRITEFKRYAVRIETAEGEKVQDTPKTLPSWELARKPTLPNLGELLWRLGLPLAALNLALLAIPLSFVSPRAGRTNNLVLAILTYLTYNNVLSVSQAWVSQGRLPFHIGIWAVHLAMFVLLVALFYRRILVVSWRRVRS